MLHVEINNLPPTLERKQGQNKTLAAHHTTYNGAVTRILGKLLHNFEKKDWTIVIILGGGSLNNGITSFNLSEGNRL